MRPPPPNAVSLWLRRAIVLNLVCIACYFLGCLRVSYTREYFWTADVKNVYSVLSQLNHKYGTVDVQIGGLYIEVLNYYRETSQRETFPEFIIDTPEHSPGRAVYVIQRDYFHDFIVREKLAVIYDGNRSNLVVAVPPNGSIPTTPVIP